MKIFISGVARNDLSAITPSSKISEGVTINAKVVIGPNVVIALNWLFVDVTGPLLDLFALAFYGKPPNRNQSCCSSGP